MANKVARAGETVNGQRLLPGSGAPGPGRPKGSQNKQTAATRAKAADILQQILRHGPTPLEIMWKMMKGPNYPGGIKFDSQRLEAAKAAAPYVHPKLSQIQLSGQLGITHEEALARLDKLDDDTEEPSEADYEIIDE